jgi:hypothetical protein
MHSIFVHWKGAVRAQYISTLEGCRLLSCCKFYDSVCHAVEFGQFLAKGCDRIVALTPSKQKHPLKLSAHINRTTIYASSGMWRCS